MLFQVFSSSLSVEAKTVEPKAIGTTYYVSTLDGSDRNDGLSENKAFYSLQKINEIQLKEGDKVLLEADSVFTNGFLHVKGSGSEEAPIEINRYGEGNNTRIDTNGQGIWYQYYGKPLDSSSHKLKGYVSSSILLYDVEYINIKNLEITNNPLEIDAKYNNLQAMNRTGVTAVAQNKGTIDHIYLDGLNIHDVMGNVYDKHMNNGGIYFTVFLPKNEAETGISRYNDVKIENSIVDNVNRWGIAVGYTAYWDKFLGAEISDEAIAKYGSTGVEIRNNYVKDAGGDAITTMYCDRPIIEYNVSDGVARQINTTDYSVPTEETHGLLVDTLGTASREQGHSMVYRAPKYGTIVLSVKDNEPYLRQGGNANGKVKLRFTHNGEEISSYELIESLARIDVKPMEIKVEKGDFIRIEAQNIDNPTKPSIHVTPKIEYQNIDTPDLEAPTAPSNIKADNITENSVDISWTGSSDNIGVVGYEVYESETLLKTVTDETSTRITDLAAETEYTLSVKAFDEAGNKSEAGSITFITNVKENLEGPIVVSKVDNLEVTEVTNNTVKLQWNAPSSIVGLTEYVVYKDGKEFDKVSLGTTEIVINELKANTIYGFKVNAKYSNGEESKPKSINIRTKK